MRLAFVLLILILGSAAAGCMSNAGTQAGLPVTAAPSPDTSLNLSVRPGNDLFSYVNDAWIADHPIPADRQSYTTFTAISDKVDGDLHALLANASNATPASSDRNITLIGEFYRSGMDNATLDRDGLAPLAGDLAMINAIQIRDDLKNTSIVLLEHGSGPLYSYAAEVNPRNSTEMVPGLEQGGIGLPDRDYYLRNDNESRRIQEAYRSHIAAVLKLTGETDARAAADAATVYAMETTLAESQYSVVENQDPQNTTNLYTPAELSAQYPAIGWDRLVTLPGSGPVSRINVHQPRFIRQLNTLMETAPLDDWKVYLKYQLTNDMSPYLSGPFEEEHFAFYSTTLNGVTAMEPRWKRVVHTESDVLGDLVGREYVAACVDPRTRGMVSDMFATIRQTFDARIANLTWMGNSTKAAAREKLAAMGEKIAYPDTWMDYSGLNLTGSYAANVRAAAAYNFIHGPSGIDRIGSPVDPTVWYMTPQTVNAYYDPTRNEMVFPAAILQPPFFDPDADAAANYGALGWVIGHEMTHGFDNMGRQFDKNGNIRDWWTPEDAASFGNRTAVIMKEYNGFAVLPGLYVNGNQTLGENIADFGGITLAYHAWKASPGPSGGNISGSTADREFFIAAARIWRGSYRDEALRTQVYTDPHTNGRYRVDGALFNVPEFYTAFPEIQPGDALYRNESERALIW